jgi:hypothetical protein
MYCPRCAAQNPDETKFCRACGTNLETVALALSGRPLPAEPSEKDKAATPQSTGKSKLEKRREALLETRREGFHKIVQGTGLLVASLLIGLALGLFSNAADWIIIWVGLAGWMACWGVISLTSGIGAITESRFIPRQLEQKVGGTTAPIARPLTADEPEMLPEASATLKLSPPPSVTEDTTEPLSKRHQTTKQIT